MRLRPRPDSIHITQGRTALEAGNDGFLDGGARHGLFAYETRFLSRYIWRINGQIPQRVALSQVRQHTSLGYWIMPPPGARGKYADAAQYAVELRLSRYVGDGFHEDVDVTNHNGKRVTLRLEFEVAADFVDQIDLENVGAPFGTCRRKWQRVRGGWELA